MKRIMIMIAAAAVALAGCKHTPPSQERIHAISVGVGKAAALAVELSKTKQEVKDAIAQVLATAREVVPAVDETFVSKWTPLVDAEVAKLVEAGKLDKASGELVKGALYVACEGIDLVFVRYPEAKKYQNLVSAAVDGFCDGFGNGFAATCAADGTVDKDALEYLKKKAAK